MIAAISFVPVEDVIQAFEELCLHSGDVEQEVLDYFETNYIGGLRRGRRLAPRSTHEVWNMYTHVQDNLPRTNNDIEGRHNRFANSCRHHHANIWKFIDGLKGDSALNHMAMMQQVAGVPNPPQRPLYREVNQRKQTLVAEYRNDNIINFLTGISFNLAQ